MGKKTTRFRNFLLALDEWTTVKFEYRKESYDHNLSLYYSPS